MTAKSIDEAKQALLNNLNLDQFEIYDFEIIQEPTKGFLGIGSKDAEVRLLIKTDKLQKGKFLVTEMCKHMGYSVDFEANIDEEKQELRFEFSGDSSAKMFKQLGRGAHKMVFLINCILNRKDRESYLRTVFVHENISQDSTRDGRSGNRRTKKHLKDGEGRNRSRNQSRGEKSDRQTRNSSDANDVELSSSSKERNDNGHVKHKRRDRNFDNQRGQRRSRGDSKTSSAREAYLKNTAERMAKQVIESQKSVAMNPMNSYDRRIVHSALTDTKNISTRSEGENDKRYVVIEYSAE